MKLKLMMSALVLCSGMSAFANEIVTLSCRDLIAPGMKSFLITLAEESMMSNANEKITNGSEVKVVFNNGSMAFATEDSSFSYNRSSATGAFYIGDQTFIRVDRTEGKSKASYRAVVIEDRTQYRLKKFMTSSCKLVSRGN